jgi:aqualysin 1
VEWKGGRTIRRFLSAAILLVVLCSPLFAQSLSQPDKKFRPREHGLPGKWLVVLRDEMAGPKGSGSNARQIGRELVGIHGGLMRHVWRHGLQGFTADLTDASAKALSQDPRVRYVVQDGLGQADDFTQSTSVSWGLDRIDQQFLPLDGLFSYSTTASNVHVYVVDSGVRPTHQEFMDGATSRVTTDLDLVNDGYPFGQGHGTKVAGLAGGSTTGVAKAAHIHSLKIIKIDNSFEVGALITALQWVMAYHQSPAVVNLSLHVGIDPDMMAIVDYQVQAVINQGITVVAAAGNDDTLASTVSPARLAAAITVGASNSADGRYVSGTVGSGSNYGGAVDVWAPGGGILTAEKSYDSSYVSCFGTSCSAPLVSGIAALYLSLSPSASPAAVQSAILANATYGVLSNIGAGSPNLLAYSGFIVGGSTPVPTGRYKLDGSGNCYWDSNDSGFDQCEPPAETGRCKVDGSGGCYWDANDSGPDQCDCGVGIPAGARWAGHASGLRIAAVATVIRQTPSAQPSEPSCQHAR